MCVYLNTCVCVPPYYVYLHTYVYYHTRVCVSPYMCLCTSILCVPQYICVCVSILVCVCISIHLFVDLLSYTCVPIDVCRVRERGRISKSVFHDLVRYVLCCAIERQL